MEIDCVNKIPVPICEICFCEYDHHKNRPLIIIPCCHSYCESCLNKIEMKCPKCNTSIIMKSINWSLLNIIPEQNNNTTSSSNNNVNNNGAKHDHLISSCESWFAKGIQLLNTKRHEEAIIALDMAISIKPSSEMYYTKGKCLIELKKYKETIIECDKSIQLAPIKPKPKYLKGFALYKMKMFEKALVEFDYVISIVPNEFMPYHLKASCLHQMNKYSEAIVFYNRALSLCPNYYASTNNRNVAQFQLDSLNALNRPKSIKGQPLTMTLRPRK